MNKKAYSTIDLSARCNAQMGINMATTVDYIEYVCEQVRGYGELRYNKMFGEYMVYINDKPILLVCDNTVYVKMLDCIAEIMKEAQTGFPYKGAKEHYVLDIESRELSMEVVAALEPVTLVPKRRVKKADGKENTAGKNSRS